MTEIPNKIWRKMSQKEQYEAVANGIVGFHHYDSEGNVTAVMMGMASFKRIDDFNKKMIKKYNKTKNMAKHTLAGKTTDQHKLKSKGQTPVKAAAEAKKDKFKFPKTKLK